MLSQCSPPCSPHPLPLYKIFLKIQVHLFFGCFVICIYYIDSVTSVTFYGLSPSKKNFVIFFIESLLKLMANAFYFTFKALFILKIFQFLSLPFGHVRKMGLIRRIRLTSKFMASQPGLQTIVIHILLNISQSKGNQTMKFG